MILNFTKFSQSYRIFYGYLSASVLIIFCTFWLFDFFDIFTFVDFGGFCVGYAAFSSAFLVLSRFAQVLVSSGGNLGSKGWRKWFIVLAAGFFKFIFPPLAVFWGIRRGFSPLYMAGGGLVALICSSAVLFVCRPTETKALVS